MASDHVVHFGKVLESGLLRTKIEHSAAAGHMRLDSEKMFGATMFAKDAAANSSIILN